MAERSGPVSPLVPHWRFLPGGATAIEAETIASAARQGQGALSRLLRETRLRFGATRAAGLLARAERLEARRFGRDVTLLLVSSQQPLALEAPLRLAFAIAGLALDLRSLDGLTALGAVLDQPSPDILLGLDGSILLFPGAIHAGREVHAAPDAGEDADGDAAVSQLAARLAATSLAPVARLVPRIGVTPPERPATAMSGIALLDIPVPEGPLFDERFAQTFGGMLASGAANRVADAAAAFAASLEGMVPKLVVTDLDGTLWEGVVGEGAERSAEAPRLHAAYARALKDLQARGLVLAIASRNHPDDVAAAFSVAEDWPLDVSSFAARAVGWDDKAVQLGAILAELGLAPEHTLFIDDDPVNCATVAAEFPGMDVRHVSGSPEAFAALLLLDPLLSGPSKGGVVESRAALYERRAEVERLRAQTPDLGAFLARLRSVATVLPLGPGLVPRAAELGARVNQFRFSGARPSAQMLAARHSPLDLMVRLDDAFGAHGLVGLVLARPVGEEAVIDDLLLSCRALQRGVEGAMLQALAVRAREKGLSRLVGRIEVLPRNEPARDCLFRYGFETRGAEWVYEFAARGTGPLDAPMEGITMVFAPAETLAEEPAR